MYEIKLYLLSLLLSLLYTTFIFSLALKVRNNGIMKIAYGGGFVFLSLILSYITLTTHPLSSSSLLILALTICWGIRLTYRLYKKNIDKPEDSRHASWRIKWNKHGHLYFLTKTYLQIFLLQGIIISLVALPVTLNIPFGSHISLLSLGGLLLWIIGFFFEAVGDAQLDAFIRSKADHGKIIMRSGLWKYTRHPNYFGESMIWWGISFISLSSGAPLYIFISPILVTILLLFVSGIPVLEKKWDGIAEWEIYKSRTSAFIPFPPKPRMETFTSH